MNFFRAAGDKAGPDRDHNPDAFSVWLAGAGLKHGLAYGASDEIGWKAADKPVDVHDVIRVGLARAETLTRDHQVQIAVTEKLPTLSVDAASIAEVLYILLDNASKYAPPGSTIRVAAETEDTRHVRVGVTDEGPGIPTEYRERVFENFFRIPARSRPIALPWKQP